MYESDATDPVGVYDELEILSADQTGAKTVALTFSDDVTASDKLTVKKGSTEVKIDSTTYGDAAAEITLADKIVDGATYTVTLTPANGDPATSVEFVGEVATLGEIVFLNDVLVMKDSSYSKGFAYVKGYDQYGDEINLSGLTVTPGVGVFESYDPSTGKITIDDGVAAGTTSPFMTIKEVPVFVQYQNGTTVLSAQANLTVSTQAYLSDMEFGEIKKDGTARDDGRLTVTELSSKKYYIEILDPKDQYGNELTADDLNTQKNGDENGNKTLFVIPSDSGAFYLTGNFGTLGGKTILWLEDTGDSKPGTMALTITGAGGNTFTTDVTVEDDPYIQSLNVTYPMLYAGVARSDKLEFTAIDQYGDTVDLWDFKPALDNADGKIKFTDKNHMTNRVTELSVSGSALFNDVDKNAGQKDFTVTLDTRGSQKNDIESFVVTTAGMNVSTASVTVGGEGKAATIKNSGSTVQLDNRGGTAKYDFNSKIAFEDANGNTMKRDDADYPIYSNVVALDDVAVPNNFVAANYYWTLVTTKVTTANMATLTQAGALGELTYANVTAGGVAKKDIYAILWASDNAGNDYLVDQELFHFTAVVGNEETYTAKCADTLYVKKSDTYTDNVKVTVTAKTDLGETYSVADSRIRVSGIPFATNGNNVVYGNYDLDEVSSKTASVFVQDFEDGTWDEVASVTINYTNVAPVPTKVSYGFKTTANGNQAASKYGVEVSGTPADTIYDRDGDTTVTISGGVMTLTGIDCETQNYGDKVEAKIVDQYGQAITTTTFKANGAELVKGSTIAAGKNVIEYSAGSVVGRFTLNNTAAINPTIPTSTTVTTEGSLRSALAGSASTITINGDVTLAAPLVIPDGKTVIVASGKTLDDNGNAITLGNADADTTGANLVVNGTLATAVNFTMAGYSKVTVSGVWDKTAGNVAGTPNIALTDPITDEITGTGHVTFTAGQVSNINFTVTGDTLVLDGVTFNGATKLAGHVRLENAIAFGTNLVELQSGLDLDLSATPTTTGTVKFAKSATVKIETTQGTVVEVANNNSSAADSGIIIAPSGAVTGGATTTSSLTTEETAEAKAAEADLISADTTATVTVSASTATSTTFAAPVIGGVTLASATATATSGDFEVVGVTLNGESSTLATTGAAAEETATITFTTVLGNTFTRALTTLPAEVSDVGNTSSASGSADYTSATGTTGNVFTGGTSTIYAYDQYGNKISTAITEAVDVLSTLDGADKAKFSAASYTVAGDGAVTISVTSSGALSVDDTATVTIGGEAITIRCTTAHTASTEDGAVSFTVNAEV